MRYLILLVLILLIGCSSKQSSFSGQCQPTSAAPVSVDKPDPEQKVSSVSKCKSSNKSIDTKDLEDVGYGDEDPNLVPPGGFKGLLNTGAGAPLQTDYLKSQLDTGAIAYNIPDKMKMGKKYRIELHVDSKKSDALVEGLGSSPTIVAIQISLTMKATLTGDGFIIDTSISSSVQLRKFDSPTVWVWDVTPKKSGVRGLKLKIVSILKRSGYSDENYDLVVYEVSRKIQSDVWLQFKDIAGENWKTILGFVISSGLLAWIVRLIKGKKKKEE